MKRAFFALLTTAVLASSTGCCIIDRVFHCRGCVGPSTYEDCCWEGHGCAQGAGCGSGGCATGGCADGGCAVEGAVAGGCTDCGDGRVVGPLRGAIAAGRAPRGGQQYFEPGPPTGAVTYPYYTNRGPRDFLARHPGNIGP